MADHAEEMELLSALVGVSSPSGGEHAVQDYIAGWFRDRGIEPRLEPVADGLVNVVVEIEGAGHGPTLFLGGHCDTVAAAQGWSTDPLRPEVKNGRLYALGAMDMKGGLACAMLATADLAAQRDAWGGRVIFAALADEEARSRGAVGFLESLKASGQRVDAALMCEPHFRDPVIGAMGKFNIVVKVTGRSAHGSRPAEGVSAITAAARLIAALEHFEHPAHPEFGPANHCILKMQGGPEAYQIRVPDSASFLINWHVMPGESSADVLAAITALAEGLNSPARFEITVAEPRYESYWLGESHPFVAGFAGIYEAELGTPPQFAFGKGVSDANIFNSDGGIPTINFGPSGANMHAADEWVELSELPDVRRVLRAFGLGFLRA